MAGKAVPPSKLSHQIECRAGVTPLDGGSSFWAHLRWRQEAPPGQPTVVFQEDLGCKGKPWFAGVSHDVALCSRAYHAGDRTLRRVTSAGAGCLAEEGLNFPLASYLNQPEFWRALDMRPGELALKLKTNRELEKSLFFGNTWEEGLGERRLKDEQRRLEQQQRKQQAQQGPRPAGGAPPSSKDGPGSAQQPRQQAAPETAEPAQRKQQQQQQQQQQPTAAGGGQVQQPSAPSSASAPEEVPRAADGPAAAGGKPAGAPASLPAHSSEPPAPPKELAEPLRRAQVSPASPRQQAAAVPASPRSASKKAAPAPPRTKLSAVPVQQQQQQQQQAASPPAAAAAAASPQAGAGAAAGAGPQQQQQQQQQPAPPRPGQDAEPTNVWAKPPEFPAGSGKVAMYLKHGPISKGYFTISREAERALWGDVPPGGAPYEGAVELRDAASGRTWGVKSSVKKGNNRYLTATTAFNRDNALHAHDVLWLAPGAPLGRQVLFGIWRWGSQEAAAFREHLTGKAGAKGGSGSAKKRPRAEAGGAAAGAGGSGGHDDDAEPPSAKRAAGGSGGERGTADNVMALFDD